LTYSLFIQNNQKWQKYSWGLLHNIIAARTVYPGWVVRLYVDVSVPEEFVTLLKEIKNLEILHRTRNHPWDGISWRFEAADDPEVELFVTRDTDSRLCWREALAVREFVEGDYKIHAMHDNPVHHGYMHPINAGMFGARSGFTMEKMGKPMKELFEDYHNTRYADRMTDQNFLRDIIWPQFSKEALVHVDYQIPWCGAGVTCKPFGPVDPPKFVPDSDPTQYYLGRVTDHEETPVCECHEGHYTRVQTFNLTVEDLLTETLGRKPVQKELDMFAPKQ